MRDEQHLVLALSDPPPSLLPLPASPSPPPPMTIEDNHHDHPEPLSKTLLESSSDGGVEDATSNTAPSSVEPTVDSFPPGVKLKPPAAPPTNLSPTSPPAPDFSNNDDDNHPPITLPPSLDPLFTAAEQDSKISDGQDNPPQLLISPTGEENAWVTSPRSASAGTSYFKASTSSTGVSEPRSPWTKRAPASRCSQGIETASGPPPALSTYPGLTREVSWTPRIPTSRKRRTSTTRSVSSSSLDRPRRSSIDASHDQPSDLTWPRIRIQSDASTATRRSSITSQNRKMTSELSDDIPEGERTLRGMDDLDDGGEKEASETERRSSQRMSSNEDLFLNLARSSSLRESVASTREERRKSRSSLTPSHSQTPQISSSPYVEQTPSLEQGRYLSQGNSPSYSFQSTPRRSPSASASAHPLDNSGRLRYIGVSPKTPLLPSQQRFSREVSPDSPQGYSEGRRFSSQYRQSNLSSFRSNRIASASEIGENAGLEADTESTLSTNAPSTVWDELDDIKSRIKRLEATGKLPPSSAAAMSSVAPAADRPQTASTTVTTMSSSPRHRKDSITSTTESTIKGVSTDVHPLLQSALAKTKPVLPQEVYRALEATAIDALSLASFMSSSNTPHGVSASVVAGSSSMDRKIRRKADSMCRGLTELCVALSDGQVSPSALQTELNGSTSAHRRPTTRDASSTAQRTSSLVHHEPPVNLSFTSTDSGASYSRGASLEPEEKVQRRSSLIRSRIESRRASLIPSNLNSPRTNTFESPSPRQQPSDYSNHNTGQNSVYASNSEAPTPSAPASRLGRASTVVRTRRAQDEAENGREAPDIRPLTRSMTEAPSTSTTTPLRYGARNRLSRDFASLSSPITSKYEPREQPQQPQESVRQFETPQRSPSVLQSSIPMRRSLIGNPSGSGGSSHVRTSSTASKIGTPSGRRYTGLAGSSQTASDRYSFAPSAATNEPPVTPYISRSGTSGQNTETSSQREQRALAMGPFGNSASAVQARRRTGSVGLMASAPASTSRTARLRQSMYGSSPASSGLGVD